MSKTDCALKSVTVFIFFLLVNGQQPSDVFHLTAPTDFILRDNLINYIANQPGIDLITFNSREVQLTIPHMYFPSFQKLCRSANGTDLLRRIRLTNINDTSIDPFGNYHSKSSLNFKKQSIRRPNNGVFQLMRRRRKNSIYFNFNRRPSYDKIVFYLRNLAKRLPTKIKLKRIGKTVEKRYIFIVVLFGGETKHNGVFVHAGGHGSDWLSVMMALYLIKELSENTHSYPMLRMLTWHIIPVINPDGLQHSYRNPRKILVKNRNCLKGCQIGECGVDVLRNFPWNFKGSGSSTRPCSSFYAGPSAFSEVESNVLGRALGNNREHLKLYLEIHGSGSSILFPWGYSYQPCSDSQDLEALARVAAQAMNLVQQTPTNYTIGSYGNVTYPNAGGPLDFAKHHLHIKYAYVLQMRGLYHSADALAVETTLPTILETFAGIQTMVAFIYDGNLPLKHMFRLRKKKRQRFKQRSMGSMVKISRILITCHLITKFVWWLYK